MKELAYMVLVHFLYRPLGGPWATGFIGTNHQVVQALLGTDIFSFQALSGCLDWLLGGRGIAPDCLVSTR